MVTVDRCAMRKLVHLVRLEERELRFDAIGTSSWLGFRARSPADGLLARVAGVLGPTFEAW